MGNIKRISEIQNEIHDIRWFLNTPNKKELKIITYSPDGDDNDRCYSKLCNFKDTEKIYNLALKLAKEREAKLLKELKKIDNYKVKELR